MDKIELLNESTAMSKVRSGFKGSSWFNNVITKSKLKFVNGFPPEAARSAGNMQINTPFASSRTFSNRKK